MMCPICENEMTSGPENFKYDSCGLDYITLVDIEMRRCANCG